MKTKLIEAVESVLTHCEPIPVPYFPLIALAEVVQACDETGTDDELETLLDAATALLESAVSFEQSLSQPHEVFIRADLYADLIEALESLKD